MQGEVTVPYTGIGGENMRERNIYSEPTISGSTFPPGSSTGMINVKWVFPGGITNHNLWGYLLNSHTQGGEVIYDTDLQQYLDENAVEASDYESRINDLVRSYVTRVLMYRPTEDEYEKFGWIAFQNTFFGCYTE